MMQPRSSNKTIRVTTKEEFDSALKAADQVIVEGDEQLLSYAISRASRDQDKPIDVEMDGFSLSIDEAVSADPTPCLEATPLAQPVRARRQTRTIKYTVIISLAVILALALPVFLFFDVMGSKDVSMAEFSSIMPKSTPETGEPTRVPASTPEPPPTSSFSTPAESLHAIAWPAVAVVAIIALFLIARQAIANGRNVEISWKVTEKVSGRVVITKVKAPRSSARSAA